MNSFDFLTNPNSKIIKPTFIGGILSVILIIVSVMLFVREYKSFQSNLISKNLYLDQSSEADNVKVHLNILLHHAPCSMLVLNVQDKLLHTKINVPIKKTRIDSKGTRLDSSALQTNTENINSLVQETISDLDNNVGCQIESVFPIDKVSGFFMISPLIKPEAFMLFKEHSNEKYKKMNLSYQIEEFRFEIDNESNDNEKISSLLTELNMDETLLRNHVNHAPQEYSYMQGNFLMELIPYTFKDNRSGFAFRSIQNSFNSNIRVK